MSLAKFRAFIYDIPVIDSDTELLRKAYNLQICEKSTSTLAASLIAFELTKISQNYLCQDWWVTERGGLSIVGSKNTPKTRMVGKFQLNCWENLKIDAKTDWTLDSLLEFMQNMDLSVSMITQKSKMVFMKAMPTHVNKRKKP